MNTVQRAEVFPIRKKRLAELFQHQAWTRHSSHYASIVIKDSILPHNSVKAMTAATAWLRKHYGLGWAVTIGPGDAGYTVLGVTGEDEIKKMIAKGMQMKSPAAKENPQTPADRGRFRTWFSRPQP